MLSKKEKNHVWDANKKYQGAILVHLSSFDEKKSFDRKRHVNSFFKGEFKEIWPHTHSSHDLHKYNYYKIWYLKKKKTRIIAKFALREW